MRKPGGGVGVWVAGALLLVGRTTFSGYVWFDNSTDTIQVSGQTVVSNAATYEAVFFLPSPRFVGESPRIFGEWTDGLEDKYLSYNGGFNFPNSGGFAVTNAIEADVWHHIAMVHDATEERFYLDGVRVAQRTPSVNIANASGLAYIGAVLRGSQVHTAFSGYLDSLRISGTARYSGVSFEPPTGDLASDGDTLLLFNFNEAPGSTTVADESPLGRTGTLGVGFGSATSPVLVTNEGLPGLSIAGGPDTFALRWPAFFKDHGLQSGTSMVTQASWPAVTNARVRVGAEWTVTVPAPPGTSFFRLSKP